jgi:hypothetical protein
MMMLLSSLVMASYDLVLDLMDYQCSSALNRSKAAALDSLFLCLLCLSVDEYVRVPPLPSLKLKCSAPSFDVRLPVVMCGCADE